MALGSFAGGSFLHAASHIGTIIPDKITVGALCAIVDPMALGTVTAKLQVSGTALVDLMALGTLVAELQVNPTALADPMALGTSISKLQVNATALADAMAVGGGLLVAKDWSIVVAPTSTDMAVVTAASGNDFTVVSNEGSL